jgi:putative membrane protein
VASAAAAQERQPAEPATFIEPSSFRTADLRRRREEWWQEDHTCEEMATMVGYGSGFEASWLVMGAFWVGLALMLGWLVARLPTAAQPLEPAVVQQPALELLDQRFARGELDADAYRAQRALPLADRDPNR